MQSKEEKIEIIDPIKIQKLLDEKIFTRSHLTTIYILFVNLCKETESKLTPSILFTLFKQLSQITNMKYEENKIGIFHLQLDVDKDGIINFHDFLSFITSFIKFTYNEIYTKRGINSLSSLNLSSDRKLFIDIVSNLFSNLASFLGESNSNSININTSLNPFTYYDYSLKYLSFYKFYCGYKNDINMNNHYNSQKKCNELNEMFNNYTNVGYITELQNLLNSQNTLEYYKGLSIFKKSIKPLNYINNELLIIIYNNNIFIFLKVILKANLLNKVLMIFDIISNKNNTKTDNVISREVIYTFLVIIRRILNLFVFLNETFENCSDMDKKCSNHFINEQSENFKELSIYIKNKILNPLSNYYNYFYEIFELRKKRTKTPESKIKYVMYQLILLTSKIKYEFYIYFINNTNYLEWLLNDIKENLNIKNKINNKIISINTTNDKIDNNIDYICIENVVYNCINIIDIALRYENNILNDNSNNNKIYFIKNLYLKLLLIINNMQDLIFSNNINYSILNENVLNNINNDNDENIPLKSKFICLLGLLNNLNINDNHNHQKIQEFDNSKFILQIYNQDFKTKYKELTLPFNFYLKSLIINNKQILSVIAGLDILNDFFIYYRSNPDNQYCSLSSFLDFCDIILDYTEEKTLINNSNIISGLISIINKIISDNSNKILIDDLSVKKKLIELLSKITDLNNANLNEEIIDIPLIFSNIIFYMLNNFYYIEEMDYLNKKGIVFNILLVDNGLNILHNILNTNSNSYEKIISHFTPQNLERLSNLFDKISLLWEIDDKNNVNYSEEIIKNKYVFDKYKIIPKKNVLIQILLIFDSLLDYKEKYQFQNNNNYNEIFNYISEIDMNMRLKLRELKIQSEGMKEFPTLIIYTQSEKEIKDHEMSEFSMDLDGLTFYTFINCIKNSYQSDLEIFYQIEKNNSDIVRNIKTDKDFEVFIQEIMDIYENQPNKDNKVETKLLVKLKDKKTKFKRNCINCGKEMEVELDIDKEKLEELKNLPDIERINSYNKLINECKDICEECEKYIFKHIKNQIAIENSQNKINDLTGINLSSLNISDVPGPGHNTYQNILTNSLLNNNSNLLSTSLFNRTITGIGLNNNQNNNLLRINNISAIKPMTPTKNNNIFSNNILNSSAINNNTLASNMPNYRIVTSNTFQ